MNDTISLIDGRLFGSYQFEWRSKFIYAEIAIILTKKLISDSSGDISYIHIAVG